MYNYANCLDLFLSKFINRTILDKIYVTFVIGMDTKMILALMRATIQSKSMTQRCLSNSSTKTTTKALTI